MAAKFTKQAATSGFADFVLHIIPHSFFGAFADGEVLPVLLVSVLIAFALCRAGDGGAVVTKAIDSFSQVLFVSFGFIMKLAPLGAFGAMAFTVGRYGVRSIGSLGLLILTFYVACSVFVVVVLGTLARLNGFSLWKTIRYFREELLIVLGTSSSEPALPGALPSWSSSDAKKACLDSCCRWATLSTWTAAPFISRWLPSSSRRPVTFICRGDRLRQCSD